MCLVYDGNYPTGRARSNDSSQFTQRPSFDLFLPKEACKFTQRQSFDLFRLKEAWKFTQRPSFDLFRLDNVMDGYTSTRRGTEGETLIYDIRYGRLYGIKRSRGKAVLCIIGLWSFHRKKIADHVGPICSIVIMARLRTLIRDDMITVR